MDTTELVRQAGPLGLPPLAHGIIYGGVNHPKAPPTAFSEQVWVILPAGSSEHLYGPCKWLAGHGTSLPQPGAECTVAFDERNQPVVVWWDGEYASEAAPANIEVTKSEPLAIGWAGAILDCNSASPIIITVPPHVTVPFPVGTLVELCRIGSGTLTLAEGAGVTLHTPGSLEARVQYSTIGLRQRALNEWIVSGDLA